MNLRLSSIFASAAICLSLSSSGLASDYVVDQRNDNNGGTPSFQGYTTLLTTIGQTFSPTFDTLDHVEIYLRASSLGFSSEAHIDIMDAPGGVILGSSPSQIIDDSFVVRHFEFVPIDISGYSSLFLRVVEDFGTLSTQVHTSAFLTGGFGVDDYAGGAAYADGLKGGDFWFRTGSAAGPGTTTIVTTTTTTTTTTSPSTTTTSTTTTSTTTTTSVTTSTTMPGASCGDTDGDGVTATDALRTLNEAVGLQTSCRLCTCDVDSSGGVTATDSLRVLQSAVGLMVGLNCVPC